MTRIVLVTVIYMIPLRQHGMSRKKKWILKYSNLPSASRKIPHGNDPLVSHPLDEYQLLVDEGGDTAGELYNICQVIPPYLAVWIRRPVYQRKDLCTHIPTPTNIHGVRN